MKFFAITQKIIKEKARSAVETDYYDRLLKRYGILKTQDHKRDKPLLFLD
jgi:hypothetical protein